MIIYMYSKVNKRNSVHCIYSQTTVRYIQFVATSIKSVVDNIHNIISSKVPVRTNLVLIDQY